MTRKPSLPRAPRGLHAAAKAARAEALEQLADDAPTYAVAIDRYANAVEVADAARREWERLDRPLIARYPNGTEGLHPLVSTMERLDRAAARNADALGLTPVAARRLGPRRGRGQPPGANSAPDRKAIPPGVRWRDGDKPRLAVAVNRARGHDTDH
jgi:terminase small subunit-like protein